MGRPPVATTTLANIPGDGRESVGKTWPWQRGREELWNAAEATRASRRHPSSSAGIPNKGTVAAEAPLSMEASHVGRKAPSNIACKRKARPLGSQPATTDSVMHHRNFRWWPPATASKKAKW